MAIRFDRYPGLYKTIIISTVQTICQIIKYYQTIISRVWGIYPYGDMGYRGSRVSSLYRRIPPIPLYETLNVSHNGQGGIGQGR
jgi:hypothetical protein